MANERKGRKKGKKQQRVPGAKDHLHQAAAPLCMSVFFFFMLQDEAEADGGAAENDRF